MLTFIYVHIDLVEGLTDANMAGISALVHFTITPVLVLIYSLIMITWSFR